MNYCTTDPTTSRRAGQNAARFAGAHKARILDAIQSSQSGLTAHEIHLDTGLTVEQVCRRLPEMDEIEVLRVHHQDVERGGFRVWKLKG